jgi:hypothetical protein
LNGEYEEEGFKMTDLESYIDAIKINWMTRLVEIEGIWKEFIRNKIDMDLHYFAMCNIKYADLHFKIPKDSMWDEVLKKWCKENSKDPETIQGILNQNIWRNSHIKIGKKTQFWKHWYEEDIKWVADMVYIDEKNERRFLTFAELNELASGKITIMEYNSIMSALPKSWKKKKKK